MVHGLCHQLYNCPLDLCVETRVHDRFPGIEASQFVNLSRICRESLRVVEDKELQKLTPSVIFSASTALNCATAMFVGHLFPSRTDFTRAYRSTPAFGMGARLFELWKARYDRHMPGDEYLLVDSFAEALGLADWIEWSAESAPDSGPEPMRSKFVGKEDDATMFCLDALKRFEKMSPGVVFEVAREIAVLGMGGIDHSTPGKTYELKSIQGEKFTGLQLLCLMHVGLRKTDPAMDTGLDLDGPYKMALEAFKGHLQ